MHPDPFVTPSSAIISPNIIRYLLKVADAHSVSLDRALRSVSLTRASIDAATLRFSYRQGRSIIEQALELLPVRALGVEVGALQPITSSGVLGLAMMSSATLEDAVEIAIRFQNLAGSMVRWRSWKEERSLIVSASLPETDTPVGRFLIEEGFANITRMARDVAGIEAPRLIELSYDFAALGESYRAYFRCPVKRSAAVNAWHLPIEYAGLTLPAADEWAHREAVSLLEAEARSVLERQELVATLAAHIEEDLPEVKPLSDYARILAVSERTLRRRLVDVGSNYSRVLDDVRKRLAAGHFAKGELSLSEVSYRLGYSDERSLRRSTLRWFGSQPGELRKSGALDRTI